MITVGSQRMFDNSYQATRHLSMTTPSSTLKLNEFDYPDKDYTDDNKSDLKEAESPLETGQSPTLVSESDNFEDES